MASRQAIFCLVALLAFTHARLPAHAQPGNDTLQFTEKWLSSKIGYSMQHVSDNMKKAMGGALKQTPEQPKQKISVSCLNSVAPAPLGWQMWCPDTHATVTQWVDRSGSTHRKIVLQPMPSMTADMAVWFMSPMFPKTLTVNGKTFTKNQLWHPLDHKKRQEFKLAPAKDAAAPVMLMSKLDEVYRAPVNTSKVFRTELWLSAMNLADNLPLNRYVLGYDVLGFQVFTLLVDFENTSPGLVVSIEVIVGAAAKGYDVQFPKNGVSYSMAKAANTLLLESALGASRQNGDFAAALDAVTRHVVEEFGNLPNFVPQVWGAEEGGKLAGELAQFKKNIINLVKPGSKVTAAAAAQAGL